MFSTSPEHHRMFWKVSRILGFFKDFRVLGSYLIHSGAPESPPGLVTIQVKVTGWLYVIHTLCTRQLLQCEMISNTILKDFSVWMFLLFILIHLTTFRRLSGEKICNGSNVGRYRCRIWYIDNIFSWKIDPRLKWRLRFVAAKNGGFYISMLIQLTLEKCSPSNENLHVSPECYQNIQVWYRMSHCVKFWALRLSLGVPKWVVLSRRFSKKSTAKSRHLRADTFPFWYHFWSPYALWAPLLKQPEGPEWYTGSYNELHHMNH